MMLSSGNMLAAVVSPLFLWAGGAAVSVPILIHLLTRRRFRRVHWAATDFLMQANRQNRRRVRMEELILLALRCLAMLLLGLMLARLFVQPQALAAVIGSKARTERIVVLDDSFSMGLKLKGDGRADDPGRPGNAGSSLRSSEGVGKDPTVFGRAKAAVDRLAHWLREESPDDSLTVLLTSRPDRPLRSETALGKMDSRAFSDELDALSQSSRGGNIPASMAAVRQLLEGRKGNVNATVYVVSDFQQVDWSRPEEPGSAGPTPGAAADSEGSKHFRSPVSALNDWAGRGHSLRIVLVDTGVSGASNLCVRSIEPQQAQAVAGVSSRFIARVANFGKTDAAASTMRVFLGDAAQPPAAVPAIPAGETVEVPLEVSFPNDGAAAVTVELDPDSLPADNARTLSVPVARALRVLVVNGEASADPYQDEVFLLTVAIRPEGPQFSGNDVTVIDENELETADLSSYHAVLLANVYRLTEEVVGKLETYAAGGGGVGIFLGDQVDAEIYNRIAYRGGKGLMPAQLGEIITAPNDKPGFGFGDIDATQSLMRRFGDAAAGLLRGAVTWRFFASEPATMGASATAPATPSTHPAGNAHPAAPAAPARVLLRYDDAEKHPALIERPFGDGRVLLLTTSIDKEWTSLPDRPVFVVLAMEFVQHLAKSLTTGGEQLVGEPIHIHLDPAKYRPLATLKSPRYPDEPAVRIEAQPDTDTSQPVIHWQETNRPGLYRFELTETSGGEWIEQRAVNVDPRESDLTRVEKQALLESMSGMPVEYVSSDDLFQQRDNQARKELWPALLMATICVLMAEQFLGFWFGSDRNWRSLVWGKPA